ncbi:MAG TPA: DsbA family protein [Candidatus Dormibacteraeota bacterium]|nr:DsbA family protein [Candidatus Dormibacteraeota bacterium]
MPTSERITFDVYFDYLCPYVYRLAELLDAVRASGRDLDVGWRYFSLTQVNSKDDGWTVWGASASDAVMGRLAFQAAEAARRQERFAALHPALLAARHRDYLDLDDVDVVTRVAESAGLDPERFRADVADQSILDGLARDHRHGVNELGVFGTPTLAFADGTAAYVRLRERVPDDGALEVFDRLVAVAAAEPRILEIKRPRRPSGLSA